MNLPFSRVICTNKGLPCSLPLAADLVRGDFAFHHVLGMLFFEPNSMTSPLGANLNQRIGNTSLLRFERLTSGFADVQVLAKAEWANPVDRSRTVRHPIFWLRLCARGSWELARDCSTPPAAIRNRLRDAGGGKRDSGYALHASNVSAERKRILRAYGAEIIYTDPGEGSDGAIRKARELASAYPEKYYYADQYSNDANWRAHYADGTADEIWRQTEGRVTHFLAMLGTSGTFVGTSRRLKELNSEIRCISMQPNSPFHGIEGTKHMETSIVPRIYDATIADAELWIETEAAYAMTRKLAREEGLLVGVSAAGALVGALQVASEAVPGAVIVTILPDSGDKYLSEHFWDETA